MYATLTEIGNKFKLSGEFYTFEVITMGNINSSYKVTYLEKNGNLTSYLFQRVNTHVFKNPVEIMKNIDRVTGYINAKYPDQRTLHYYHTEDGLNYYVCDGNAFWRVVNFIDSVTFDVCQDIRVLYLAGVLRLWQ